MAENPEFYQRMKHIDVKHHFIREHVAKGTVDLWYIASSEMVANGLTKPLSAASHAKFVKQLRLKVIKINWAYLEYQVSQIQRGVSVVVYDWLVMG